MLLTDSAPLFPDRFSLLLNDSKPAAPVDNSLLDAAFYSSSSLSSAASPPRLSDDILDSSPEFSSLDFEYNMSHPNHHQQHPQHHLNVLSFPVVSYPMPPAAPSVATSAPTTKKAAKTRKRSSTDASSSDGTDDEEKGSTTDYGYNHSITSAAVRALGPDGIELARQFSMGVVPKPGGQPAVLPSFLNTLSSATPAAATSSTLTPASPPLTSTVSTPGGAAARRRKNFDDMDEDERLLASEEAKKLTSRERRQLRNRVSARHFRLRRKEYLSHLESLVVNMTAKINKMEQGSVEANQNKEALSFIAQKYPDVFQDAQLQLQMQAQAQAQAHLHAQAQAQAQAHAQAAASAQAQAQAQARAAVQAAAHAQYAAAQHQQNMRLPSSQSTLPYSNLSFHHTAQTSSQPLLTNPLNFYSTSASSTPSNAATANNSHLAKPTISADPLSPATPAPQASHINAGHNVVIWNEQQSVYSADYHHPAHLRQLPAMDHSLLLNTSAAESIRMKPSIVNLLPSLTVSSSAPTTSTAGPTSTIATASASTSGSPAAKVHSLASSPMQNDTRVEKEPSANSNGASSGRTISNSGDSNILDPSLLNLSFQWNDKATTAPAPVASIMSPAVSSSSSALASSSSADNSNARATTTTSTPSSGYFQLPNQQIYPSAVPDLEKQLENMQIAKKEEAAAAAEQIEAVIKKIEEKEEEDKSTISSPSAETRPLKTVSESFKAKGKCVSPPLSSPSSTSSSPVETCFAFSPETVPDAVPDAASVAVAPADPTFKKLPMITADAIFRRLDLQMANIQI